MEYIHYYKMPFLEQKLEMKSYMALYAQCSTKKHVTSEVKRIVKTKKEQ